MPPRHQTRVRVRYAETDQMGIVYHANYLIWMEIGRVELVRALGVSYHDLESSEGLMLSVIQASCRYVYPARYDQEIIVQTELASINARTLDFEYSIRSCQPDRLLAEGKTRHMWLNRDLRPTRLPPQYLKLLAGAVSD